MVALSEVMGGSISPELTAVIWASLGVEIAPHIENKFTFSQFSGIAAFCERIYCWHFCKGDNAGPSSPKVRKTRNKTTTDQLTTSISVSQRRQEDMRNIFFPFFSKLSFRLTRS